MQSRIHVRLAAVIAGPAVLSFLTLFTTACGGGGGKTGSGTPPPPSLQFGVDVIASDAPTAAWSSVDVVIQKIALRPVGGGAPVVVYDQSASSSPVHLNLVALDELGQLLTGASVPMGTTFDKLYVQIDPNTVSLTDTGNPPSSYTVAGGNVKVVGPSGFDVALNPPIRVDATISGGDVSLPVDVEFRLDDPLFLIDRPNGAPTGANGTTLYLVNFERCVRHRPHPDPISILLRDLRGSVASTTASSIAIATEDKGTKSVNVDAAGTIFYDLDAATVGPVTAATVPAGLTAGKFVRIAARYQGIGNLVAVRVWYSADAAKLRRFSPEGHVVAVDPAARTLKVIWNAADAGPLATTTVNVDGGTKFFWHGGSPIATGAAFLSNIQPGFKVQMTVADPSAATPTATNVDIERAVYGGDLGLAGGNAGLTYANPAYGAANPLSATFGIPFAWWNFTYPNQANAGSSGLITLLSGLGTTQAKGASTLSWNSTTGAWNANTCVLTPIAQKGAITASLTSGVTGFTMGFTPTGGSAETVTLSSAAGSATLVYQVQVQSGIATINPVDAANWSATLLAGTPARIFAVPTAAGLQAYVVVLLPASF